MARSAAALPKAYNAMNMKNFRLETGKATQFVAADAVKAFEPRVKAAQKALEEAT